jgi:tRNA threonylcarbamoyladenosine biosynthesis protein TsaB
VWRSAALGARRFLAMTRGHAEALIPMIESVMAEARIDYRDLNLIATTVGPGTFTGLRVGIATARALGLAANIPVVGISTLEALGHGLARNRRVGHTVVAAIDARRGEVYVQAFGPELAPLGPPRALTPTAAATSLPAGAAILVGDGADLVAAANATPRSNLVVAEGPRLPDAAIIAELCADRYSRRGIVLPEQPLQPLYLRSPGARPRSEDS